MLGRAQLRCLGSLVLAVALGWGAAVALAAQPSLRTVRYHGYVVRVPRSWPVYNLGSDPHTCVRFDRHAVYLGVPGAEERCPADAAGRTEAILVEPLAAAAARGGRAAGAPAPRLEGAATSFVARSAGVRVTATWSAHRALIVRALDRASLPRAGARRPSAVLRAGIASARAQQAASPYNGLGFDACSTPSEQTMSAWQSSPYRAIGIYIGGANSACAQPNLTSTWVSTEVATGWHLVPTYVGLQAPSNSCGCAAITPSEASAEGTAAAQDAVTHAQGLGIGAGSPIYDDMEAYSRTTTNSSAVLAFLSAWTSQLHSDGYLSGVYSSSDSGISDLVSQYGTSYPEPDDIWIANWNDEQNTSDPNVPASDWSNNQRLHQYRRAHNETYGGDTINIDGDYLDGATVNTSAPPPPTLSVSSTAAGTTSLRAGWGGSGLTAWRVLAGASPDPSTMTQLATTAASGSSIRISLADQASYFAVQALGSGYQVLATSGAVDTPAHVALFGHSAFVSQRTGVGGLAAGCNASKACQVSTTLSVGRTVIARTGREAIGRAGILYFKLTPTGLAMLLHARGHRLPVRVSARPASGAAAAVSITLIPFATAGPPPARGVTQSPAVRIIGATDFVSSGGWGGILAACFSSAPCRISARVAVGRTVIARTGTEVLGTNELGYLIFSLSSRGRAILVHATGNQLVAGLLLRAGSDTASARIVLARFS